MATMAVVASERGYAVTRVSDVLERTGISRRTFYVYFGNREDCFFAAYEAIVADISALLNGQAPDLTGAVTGLLEYFTRWPAHARVLLIEILCTGPVGAERHEQTMGVLASRLSACGPWQPGRSARLQRPALAQATLGGMLRIVQRELVTEGSTALPGLLPSLIAMMTELRVTGSV